MKVRSLLVVLALLLTCSYSIEAGESHRFAENFRVQVNGTISGTVTSINGGVVPGAKVQSTSGHFAFTNAQGKYSMLLPAGTHSIQAVTPCNSTSIPVQIVGGQNTTQNLVVPCDPMP